MKKPLIFLSLLFICSCTETTPWPSKGIYSGYYTNAFEKSIFQPSGTNEKWWLTRTYSVLSREELNKNCPNKGSNPCVVYLSLEGELSSIGEHGHLSKYNRELVMNKLISIKPVSEIQSSNK